LNDLADGLQDFAEAFGEGGMSNKKSNILGAILAVFSSVALFRLVEFVFGQNYARVVENSLGVTTGHPNWEMWQSRVLGPYIIKALTFGSLDYFKAHILFQIITVALAAFLCWRLGRKYGGSDQSALLALTLFVMCFALLLSPPEEPWLFSWDFIDIIIFILFVDLVLSGASLRWFIGLFAIAMWNRDSAAFIALWLILDPLVRFLYRRQYKLPFAPLDWPSMLAGAICIATGFLTLQLLKRNLLIEAYESEDIYPIHLSYNIAFLKSSLTHFTREFWFIVPAFLAMVMALGACIVRYDPQRYLALYLVELSFIASIFVFGLLFEMRLYLALIPFVVMPAVMLSRPTMMLSRRQNASDY
jgi:hypothetical protein